MRTYRAFACIAVCAVLVAGGCGPAEEDYGAPPVTEEEVLETPPAAETAVEDTDTPEMVEDVAPVMEEVGEDLPTPDVPPADAAPEEGAGAATEGEGEAAAEAAEPPPPPATGMDADRALIQGLFQQRDCPECDEEMNDFVGQVAPGITLREVAERFKAADYTHLRLRLFAAAPQDIAPIMGPNMELCPSLESQGAVVRSRGGGTAGLLLIRAVQDEVLERFATWDAPGIGASDLSEPDIKEWMQGLEDCSGTP